MTTLQTSVSSSLSAAAEIRKLSESAFDFAAFKQETELLHLVLYRSHNQHHVSHWWRYFSMLHKHCFRIVKTYERLVYLRARNTSGKPGKKKSANSNSSNNNNNNKSSTSTNSGKKNRGHADYSEGPAWATSKLIQDEAHYLYTKLIPAARLSFHGILRQGAFVTLGLALLGLAARLHALIEVVALVRVGGAQRKRIVERAHAQQERERKEIEEAVAAQKLRESTTTAAAAAAKIRGPSERMDMGEVISRDDFDLGEPVSQRDFDLGESVSRDDILKSLSPAAMSHESLLKPEESNSTSTSTDDKHETTKKQNKPTGKKRSTMSLSATLDGFDQNDVNNKNTDAPVLKKLKKSSSKDRDPFGTGDKEKKKSKKKSKKNAIDSIFGF